MPKDADELVALLDLERIDDNLFRGQQMPSTLPRVFGGQAAAQALVAATRTVDPAYVVHSLHSYFLQPGDTQAPTIYDVETLRDGRSFATRRGGARPPPPPRKAPPPHNQPPPPPHAHPATQPPRRTPRRRLSTTGTPSGTGGRSRPGGGWRASTAGRSTR